MNCAESFRKLRQIGDDAVFRKKGEASSYVNYVAEISEHENVRTVVLVVVVGMMMEAECQVTGAFPALLLGFERSR